MQRQSLINLFLLLIVLMLGLFVWLSPEETTQPTQVPLTDLNPADIQQIEIQNNNGPRFVMQRQSGSWQMTEPYPVQANGPRIDILMDLLSTPQVEALPLPTERLAEFGLDSPLATVTFNDTQITFGGTHPYNYRRYVRINDQLYLTNDIFPHHVLAQAEDFISHALFPENIQLSEIKTPDWQLIKAGDRWEVTPTNDNITQAQLQEKVDAWLHTWVSKVSKAPKETFTEEITLQIDGITRPITLGIVRQKKQLLLVRQELGLAYRLTSDSLLKPPGAAD
jgi:hypothetical protein